MFFRLCLLLCFAVLGLKQARTQTSIRYDASSKVWQISSGEMTYALGVDEVKGLQSLYWGPRLDPATSLPKAVSISDASSVDAAVTLTPLEYPGWGAGLSAQPAVKITFPGGNRSLLLDYFESKQTSGPSGDALEIMLRDRLAEVYVHLFYKVYPQGVLARWSRIENKTNGTVTVEQAGSATLNLEPAQNYELSWLTGHWAAEWEMQKSPLRQGHMVLESRRGSTSQQTNPWFAIGRSGETTEKTGPVWFGLLGWSGSWQIDVEKTASERVRITGGYNPFDFSYPLAPGESLETPPFYAGYTSGGEGQASRILHRFETDAILPGAPRPKLRPILFNSWEATRFHLTEAGQLALAEKAASLGVERMVIDDAWFGHRTSSHAGLGDWYVNREIFPHGLKPVIDRVHALGMDFGLWVEPEMVNPDSDLYRKHPEWAMNFPGRPRTEARNQLMLNLARDDVRDYVLESIDTLLNENDIAFLKWDYNRAWSEPGWDAVAEPNQKKIYVASIGHLYGILAELRRRHPKLEIESCAGGGGRVDLGVLRYAEQVWPSDNTDAFDRLSIQDGFTHAYSPGTMMSWVTDVPNYINHRSTPLSFRFMVAMTGALSIGSDLTKWTPEERTFATRMIAFYKTIRETVQRGSLYRLMSPVGSEESALEYTSRDGHQVVVFAFLHSQHFGRPFSIVRVQGLEPSAFYRVTALDASKVKGLAPEMTGSALMGKGIIFNLVGDYDSAAIVLEKIESR